MGVVASRPAQRSAGDTGKSWWRDLASSPLTVAGVVAMIYVAWLVIYVYTGHSLRDFIHLGSKFLTANHRGSNTGYDGQWSYYLAVDPTHAYYHMDAPSYRYTRIVYPMVARLLAGGQATLVPYTLVVLNLLALVGGTLAVALYLRRNGFSPWYGLIFGLYPGLFISLIRDLTEPLAYALVAWAIVLFECSRLRNLTWSGIAFGLAALTRESTILFTLAYGVGLLLNVEGSWARLRRPALFFALALGPFLVYKLFIQLWLGSSLVPTGDSPTLIPFQGLMVRHWKVDQSYAIVAIVGPSLVCAAAALRGLMRDARRVELWALVLNVLLFVVFLNAASYSDIFASARVTTGVVVAGLVCIPILIPMIGRLWLWVSTVGWLSFAPFWLVLVPFWEMRR